MSIIHTGNDRTPYTYLIGWSKFGMYYYGVRFAKGCHPSDLFVTYFTSSNHVKRFIDQNGLPDIIQIRKIFSNIEKARLWEEKVLKRMNIPNNSKFINKSNNKCMISGNPFDNPNWKPFNNQAGDNNLFFGMKHTDKAKSKMSIAKQGIVPWNKGSFHSDETKAKMSISKKGKYVGPNNPLYGKHLSEETKKKVSESRKGKLLGSDNPMSLESNRNKVSQSKIGRIWYHNPSTGTKIQIYSNDEIPDGFIRGMGPLNFQKDQ